MAEMNQDQIREEARKALTEHLGEKAESTDIEPLLDEALEHVAGGAEEAEWCSVWDCSKSGGDAIQMEP